MSRREEGEGPLLATPSRSPQLGGHAIDVTGGAMTAAHSVNVLSNLCGALLCEFLFGYGDVIFCRISHNKRS